MIRHLSSGSPHVTVSKDYSGVPPISPGSMSAGMLRYNPNLQQIEVYDGISWYNLSASATIDLNVTSKEAIEWAHKKMQEEKQLQDLMSKHPGLKEAYDKFEMMKALVNEKN
jgi:hypothetical protein